MLMSWQLILCIHTMDPSVKISRIHDSMNSSSVHGSSGVRKCRSCCLLRTVRPHGLLPKLPWTCAGGTEAVRKRKINILKKKPRWRCSCTDCGRVLSSHNVFFPEKCHLSVDPATRYNESHHLVTEALTSCSLVWCCSLRPVVSVGVGSSAERQR